MNFHEMQNDYTILLNKAFDLDEKLDRTIETEMTFAYPNINNIKRAARKVVEAQVKLKNLDAKINEFKLGSYTKK